MSAVQVVDSSSSRRRAVEGQAALPGAPSTGVSAFELEDDEDNDDKGHKREQQWPVSGIGMEEQIPSVYQKYDQDDKWAKRRAVDQSWVSSIHVASRRSAPRRRPELTALSCDCDAEGRVQGACG